MALDSLNKPVVSVIMPVRNEAGFIRKSLTSVLGQDYPTEKLEILIVDGMSTDNTRSIVGEMITAHPRHTIKILDNPRRIVSSAMNIGILSSTGSVIIRIDGHCELPQDYISTCVSALMNNDVQNVGGMQHAVGDTYISKAIALATNSPFFIGNSYFRYAKQERLVDTVYLGAYPKMVFKDIGLFDEDLLRHQDYDLNLRLRNQGGKILYLPSLKVKYHPRSNLLSFLKQYFQYGYWKVRVMQKSRHAFRLRHYAPSGLVLGALLGALLSILIPGFFTVYLIAGLLYLLVALFASIVVCVQQRSFLYLPVLPVIFMAIHLGWGCGFWWGALKWNVFRSG